MIDGIDRNILNIIQSDARISNAEIARKVDLAPSAVLERVRKLEERGILKGYSAEMDARSLDFGLTALIAVRTSECGEGVGEQLAAIPEVQEVHEVAGDDCFFIKVRTRDTDSLGVLLRERLKAIPNVINTRTTVVLKTFKETSALPLELMADGENGSRRKAKGK
jgi:Lrp/AsnC family leucine-responsive transcriptional regulator